MKPFLQNNDINMRSTHNEGKSWKTKFINTWLLFKNVYIDKLGYIVNKYNNTYHGTI